MFGAMSWQDGEPSQPLRMQTVPFLRSKGQPREGKGHHAGDEPRKSWQGRETERRQKTGMSWFRGLWRREEQRDEEGNRKDPL